MQGYRDDDGNLLNIMPDTIVIPNSAKLKKAVFEAVGADGIPTTANHSMNYQLGRWNVVVWPYLPVVAGVTAGKNAWYLLDSQFNQAAGQGETHGQVLYRRDDRRKYFQGPRAVWRGL